MSKRFVFIPLLFFTLGVVAQQPDSFIRINQLGYPVGGSKVVVYGSILGQSSEAFDVVDSKSGKVVFTAAVGKSFGGYGPFRETYRLDFS